MDNRGTVLLIRQRFIWGLTILLDKTISFRGINILISISYMDSQRSGSSFFAGVGPVFHLGWVNPLQLIGIF